MDSVKVKEVTLLPCFRCNQTEQVMIWEREYPRGLWIVACMNCFLEVNAHSKQEVTNKWNDRPYMARLQQELSEANKRIADLEKQADEIQRDWASPIEVAGMKRRIAELSEDANRLADRLAFQKAWLTWCPDDDKALAMHERKAGGGE